MTIAVDLGRKATKQTKALFFRALEIKASAHQFHEGAAIVVLLLSALLICRQSKNRRDALVSFLLKSLYPLFRKKNRVY